MMLKPIQVVIQASFREEKQKRTGSLIQVFLTSTSELDQMTLLDVSSGDRSPITRGLHLPYNPLESTLSDEKLFIALVFAQNLSRPNA